MLGKRKSFRLPSFQATKSPKTICLKIKRDQAEKEFISSKSPKTRDRWWSLNTSLCDLYKADEAAALSNQLEELCVADEQGHYTTTWKIIGKDTKRNVKVKMRNGLPTESDQVLLEEWKGYFSSLLNNDSGSTPADEDLPIPTEPPTQQETWRQLQP